MPQNSKNNVFSLVEVLSQNYAKAYKEYCEASNSFNPFAVGQEVTDKPATSPAAQLHSSNLAMPEGWHDTMNLPAQVMLSEIISAFAADKNMTAAIKRHFTDKNAMLLENWIELLPVLALLSQGSMLKNYMIGPQRNMMEAFLQGFAKGCPELQQDRETARNSILDAQEAFWAQIMPFRNSFSDFWSNAAHESGFASPEEREETRITAPSNKEARGAQARQQHRRNRRTRSSDRSHHNDSHIPMFSQSMTALQQAQGEMWQSYCDAFWPSFAKR